MASCILSKYMRTALPTYLLFYASFWDGIEFNTQKTDSFQLSSRLSVFYIRIGKRSRVLVPAPLCVYELDILL